MSNIENTATDQRGVYARVTAWDHARRRPSGDAVVSVRDGENFELSARNDLGQTIIATPAIVDGAIYVRTTVHLCAFGKQTSPRRASTRSAACTVIRRLL